jgi:hypothetical protein
MRSEFLFHILNDRNENDNSSYRKSGISYLRCSQIVVNNTTFGFKLNFNVKDFIDGIFISCRKHTAIMKQNQNFSQIGEINVYFQIKTLRVQV